MIEQAVIKKLDCYTNERLILLFQTRLFMKSEKVAFENLVELKKFLYIIYLVQEERVKVKNFDVISSMHELDEMWHNFILMTADYIEFCQSVFGCYIHHEPNLEVVVWGPRNCEYLRPQLQLVMDVWGSKTLHNWYMPELSEKRRARRWFRSDSEL